MTEVTFTLCTQLLNTFPPHCFTDHMLLVQSSETSCSIEYGQVVQFPERFFRDDSHV